MKIILSRKGFDSSNGGVPSPILPDGTAVSLPIPRPNDPIPEDPIPGSLIRFEDVKWDGGSLAPLVQDLTNFPDRRMPAEGYCHLSPDLRLQARPRPSGWRPACGQVGAAQRHLQTQGVGPGDLFLFFGWFRPVEKDARGRWRYVSAARSEHRIFGWLQVSEVVSVGDDGSDVRKTHPWLAEHPHVHGDSTWKYNTIYVATETLSIGNRNVHANGGGVFSKPDERLVLTAPEADNPACNRSYWRLPAWFWRDDGPPKLSFHGDPARWRRDGPWAFVRSASPGQEFVFDAAGIPEAEAWLHGLWS